MQSLQRPFSSASSALPCVVEEPVFRDSPRSHLHQLVDVVAYFAKQVVAPSNFIRDKVATQYFTRSVPINLLAGNPAHPPGIRMQ